MAGKTIWKGTIHFGGVDVPVKLHTAVREERILFHLLHRRDQVRLKQQMVCASEKLPVPAEEQTRGFELEEGRYILLDPEELEQTDPVESRLIEVHEFVKAREIDPVFFEKAYYLEPEGASKGYHALAGALREMDVQGLCTWTMRKRSYLGALQMRDGTLRLNVLRYADEVIAARSLELPGPALSEKELKIAGDLIAQLTAPFEPSKFEDEHRVKLQKLIDQKARGEKIAILRPRRLKPTQPDRLLETLEASLKKVA